MAPRERDFEEYMESVDVSLSELDEIILSGKMMLPAVQTSIMAKDWIKHNLGA